MSFSVWIKIEADDNDGDEVWWAMNTYDSVQEAIEAVENICNDFEARTGVAPEKLDD